MVGLAVAVETAGVVAAVAAVAAAPKAEEAMGTGNSADVKAVLMVGAVAGEALEGTMEVEAATVVMAASVAVEMALVDLDAGEVEEMAQATTVQEVVATTVAAIWCRHRSSQRVGARR